MQSFRSLKKEIIDLGPSHYTIVEYEDCLVKLGKIGKWLGGDGATLNALKKMDPCPSSILDVGCGGGLFSIKMAEQFSKAHVKGIDLNPLAIEFAKKQKKLPHLTFECTLQEKLQELPKSFDVVSATLVCHHLNDEQLVDFIKAACKTAKRKVVINDLHRHVLPFYLFKIISPLFFRNRLIQHDGALSIQRAFTYGEWINILEKSGVKCSSYQITWCWAFRWIVEIKV